ncbi:hypothetical protein [Sinorhizobium meliloti]|uniref:hypothetical protein n=1 Tax=Rhizobium meliloti TaxID=382 RepID=UPI00299D7050|nr:hypothetical protein [Sinorhizobium meliloti]MDW9690555.1 hypothetical protein [Sinorhizobium meliloti]MDW9715400.1 hypothetical protein [Sinorhizobium meliloti]MDW9756652.1 hypothetical protein [Sinorhizobium meliloti]
MPETPVSPAENQAADFRARLGMRLVLWSTTALVILAAIVVIGAFLSDEKGEVLRTSQLLLSSLLPLFATWVGTVLAFYYTKENYQTATQGTLDIVRTVGQRLASTQVQDVMMSRGAIISQTVPAGGLDATPLSEIEQKFASIGSNGSRISRLHLFDQNDRSIAILHRSVWSEMLVAGLKNKPPIDVANGTLGELTKLPYPSAVGGTFEEFITKTVAFVAINRTLAEAKSQMEAKPGCQDVIVTQTGSASEPVRGWISNIDIGRLSQAS